MKDSVPTSWRRRSDSSTDPKDRLAAEKSASSIRVEAHEREAWEAEGGRRSDLSSKLTRILIVDCDMGYADSLQLALNAAGYRETLVAYSGHAGVALAEGFRPEVAFLEMNLLDMDSNELARSLREHAHLAHIRLIAMTNSRHPDGREVARSAGFEHYLLKPIDVMDVSKLLAG